MNNTILTGLISLVIGIGVGWLLKPTDGDKQTDGPTPEQRTSAGQRTSSSPAHQPAGSSEGKAPGSSKSGRRVSAKKIKSGAGETPWNSPEMGKVHERMAKGLKSAHEAQLSSLTEKLKLTPSQKEQLFTRYFEPIRKLSSNWTGLPDSDVAPPPELGQVLADILTTEQTAEHKRLFEQQQRRRRESTTLRQLADLSFLDLSADQRQEAYDALYEHADAHPNGIAIRGIATSVVSLNIDSSESTDSLAEVTPTTIRTFTTSPGSSGAIIFGDAETTPEARAERIEQDAARFAAIFTPEQMATYRNHLERRQSSAGFYPGDELPPLPQSAE